MAIAENIKDQLLFNGRITLSDFGTLELVKESARITENKIIPPLTRIVFNPSITDDDDRLTGSFASAGEINIDEARNLIKEYINTIRNALNSGGEFVFEGFGKLYKDSNDSIKFEKNPDFIIDFDSYGLESFELELPVKDLSNAVEPPQKSAVIDEVPVKFPEIKSPYIVQTKKSTPPKKRPKILWAIPVTLIIIIAGVIILKFTAIIPDKISSEIFNFKTKKTSQDDSESRTLDANQIQAGPITDSLSQIENAVSKDAGENSAFIAVPFVDSAFKEYHVIAGSFSDTINARELSWELTQEGYHTLILHQGNNLYRVSAISFKKKEEGLKGLHKFRAQTKNNAAWLLGLN